MRQTRKRAPRKPAGKPARKRVGNALRQQGLVKALAGKAVSPELEAEAALYVCYGVARATLFFEGKKVSNKAKAFWFDHYRVTFTKAIVEHHRHLKDDIWHLCARSTWLGLRAAHHAGADPEVSEAAAKEATKDTSCPSKTVFLHWCAA